MLATLRLILPAVYELDLPAVALLDSDGPALHDRRNRKFGEGDLDGEIEFLGVAAEGRDGNGRLAEIRRFGRHLVAVDRHPDARSGAAGERAHGHLVELALASPDPVGEVAPLDDDGREPLRVRDDAFGDALAQSGRDQTGDAGVDDIGGRAQPLGGERACPAGADPEETADLLEVVARREQEADDREVSVHGEKGGKTLTERQEYVVSSVAEVGPVTARALLEHFGSVEAVMTADEEALRAVDGVGEVTAERIREVTGSDYAGSADG